MRYRLRTLMIVLALGPMVLALIYWRVEDYQRRQRVREALREIGLSLRNYSSTFQSLPVGARLRNGSYPSEESTKQPSPIE